MDAIAAMLCAIRNSRPVQWARQNPAASLHLLALYAIALAPYGLFGEIFSDDLLFIILFWCIGTLLLRINEEVEAIHTSHVLPSAALLLWPTTSLAYFEFDRIIVFLFNEKPKIIASNEIYFKLLTYCLIFMAALFCVKYATKKSALKLWMIPTISFFAGLIVPFTAFVFVLFTWTLHGFAP